jgi:hypothetical protein
MTDRLSDRIREEQDISRIRAFNRLAEADDVLVNDSRITITRRARRGAALSYLKVIGCVLAGAAVLIGIFLLRFTLEGGFR